MLVRVKCVYTHISSAELCLDLTKLESVKGDDQIEFRQERLKEFFSSDCGNFSKCGGGLGLDLGFLDSSRKAAVPFSMLWIRSLTCLNQPETRVLGKWKSWLQRS